MGRSNGSNIRFSQDNVPSPLSAIMAKCAWSYWKAILKIRSNGCGSPVPSIQSAPLFIHLSFVPSGFLSVQYSAYRRYLRPFVAVMDAWMRSSPSSGKVICCTATVPALSVKPFSMAFHVPPFRTFQETGSPLPEALDMVGFLSMFSAWIDRWIAQISSRRNNLHFFIWNISLRLLFHPYHLNRKQCMQSSTEINYLYGNQFSCDAFSIPAIKL